MSTTQSLPENQDQVKSKNQSTPQPYTCLDAEKRWQDYQVTLQKCSCGSSWCPKCWQSRGKIPAIARLKTFSWSHTRHLMVTVNPSLFNGDGEIAWKEITFKRGIGNLIKELGRSEGIEIVDWEVFVEWHEKGFAHWHLIIEVSDEGRAGMIGRDRVKRHWPWGIWIREEGIRNQAHWNRMIGYFDRHGYFEGGKGNQGILPDWAKSKNIRIKRWESMKGKKGIATMRQDERSSKGEWFSMGEKRGERRNYGVILEECGNKTRVIVLSNSLADSFIVNVNYSEIKEWCRFPYIEGKGLVGQLTDDEYLLFISELKKLELGKKTREEEGRDQEEERPTPPLRDQRG